MPRAPRRRKIDLATKAAAIVPTIPEDVAKKVKETELPMRRTRRSTNTRSSTLLSSPPNRRPSGALESNDGHSLEVVAAREAAGGVESDVSRDATFDESLFLPKVTSTPKSVSESGKKKDAKRQSSGLRRAMLAPDVSLENILIERERLHEPRVEPQDSDVPSSESSDMFGFTKIRGLHAVKVPSRSSSFSSSPESSQSSVTDRQQSAGANEEAAEPSSETDARPVLSPPSSPLTVLSRTPSPTRRMLSPPEHPESMTKKSAKQARRTEKAVTTAQLTRLLPHRANSRKRRRLHDFDVSEDSSELSEIDVSDREPVRPVKRRKQTQSEKKKRQKAVANAMVSPKLSRGKDGKPEARLRKPLAEYENDVLLDGQVDRESDREGFLDDDGDDTPDSQELRELESARLKQKFKEVDEWDLEVENVDISSDSFL